MTMHQPPLPVDFRMLYIPPPPLPYPIMPPPGIDMPPPQAMVMPPQSFPVMPLTVPTDLMLPHMSALKTVLSHNRCLPNVSGQVVGKAPELVSNLPVVEPTMDEVSQSHGAPGYMSSTMSKADIPGGRPYERRNKKKRPMDYYRKLEARQSDTPCSGALLVNGDSATEQDAQLRLNDDSVLTNYVGVTADVDSAIDTSCHHKPGHICAVAGGDASSGDTPANAIKLPTAQSTDFSISNQLFSDGSRTDSSVASVADTPTDICSTDVCAHPVGSDSISNSDETVAESTAPSVAISVCSTDTDQTGENARDLSKRADDDSSVPVASPESDADKANTAMTVVHEEVATTAAKQAPVVSSWAGLFKGRPSATTDSTVVLADRNARVGGKSDHAGDRRDEKGTAMPMPVSVEQDAAARQLGRKLMYSRMWCVGFFKPCRWQHCCVYISKNGHWTSHGLHGFIIIQNGTLKFQTSEK